MRVFLLVSLLGGVGLLAGCKSGKPKSSSHMYAGDGPGIVISGQETPGSTFIER